MKIKIYQINSDRDRNTVKFLQYKHLDNFQETKDINAFIYDEVFSGDVDCENLEDIYRKFNTEGHPLHRGHSLSVSDVVVTKDGAYYCDSVGFQKVDFDQSLTQKPENVMTVVYVEPHKAPYQSSQDMSGILAKQERLKAIQAHIDQLININSEAAQNGDFDEQFDSLHKEMYAIMDELAEADKTKSKIDTAADSIGEMAAVMNGLKNHPVEYNDLAVRQLIECIKVMSADTLHIYFKDGTKIEATL